MAERRDPQVFSIAAHRGFADALVAGLVPRYGEADVGLARLTLLLPSQRAVRTVTEAFIRHSGSGLLLPRMVVVGDLDLDETLGPLLDPLGAGADVPPAADPVRRWLRLASLLADELGDRAPPVPALLRQARDVARTIDRLLVEGIDPADLLEQRIVEVAVELAEHWKSAFATFAKVQNQWRKELDARGEIDPPERRNRLFAHAAQRWSEQPPPHPVVAAGVTSASPALARLLRVVADSPRGAVILPDLDLALDDETWVALGLAGMPAEAGGAPFGAGDAFTHPQYHLKLLLNRMGVARSEVHPWHRAGLSPAPPARSLAISNLFLPPAASARWVNLEAGKRRLSGVRLIESANPAEESLAVALLIRQALEVPEKRVALVTPDRDLAARTIAQLQRWGIRADDTAGQPLPLTAAGRLFLQLVEVAESQCAPVPLLALLGHPLSGENFGRAEWLDHVRALDLKLRGPRPMPGPDPLRVIVADLAAKNDGVDSWWQGLEAILSPLLALDQDSQLAEVLDALIGAAEAIAGERAWAGADGRALAGFVEGLRDAARAEQTRFGIAGLTGALRDAMELVAVRPPWGGHPRVAIYGLIEARMSRADLVICAGLAEGVWPAVPAPDPLLAPPVLRALGVPGADFRIGLSAHDLAGALGAPEVVLSHARRDAAAPTVPSRFLLRVQAILGEDLLKAHLDTETPRLVQRVLRPGGIPEHPQPAPRPSPEQRDVAIAVTGLDRLRSDPYSFYASEILRLRALDPLDAEPSARWKGEVVHRVLEHWHDAKGSLADLAQAELRAMQAHPLVRHLWWPRLFAGLQWVESQVAALKQAGRVPIAWEAEGHLTRKGVKIKGRADRIDRIEGGGLAIVDYKTGHPPQAAQVEAGYALQLGLIALMAQEGAFAGVSGEPKGFEYWSLGAKKGQFGYMVEPVPGGRKKRGIAREVFVSTTAAFLDDAIDRWIKGDEPFTARPHPDAPVYNDYDQLMRLDEWLTRREDLT